jgi:MFS family permease
MPTEISSRSALILIVIAQFLGTSLWFAGNVAAPEFEVLLAIPGITSWIVSAVQLGFILGTFVYAFWSVSDRFSPSSVFFLSAFLAALSNFLITVIPPELYSVLGFRFLAGFFLAGIYPVGMKIAADYFEKGLGSALGFLVGALVLGTAFPFILKATGADVNWKTILWATSGLALTGGALVGFFVPNGPFRKPNPAFDLRLLPTLAQNNKLRAAASGYFGHMWELYTFWTFLPLLIRDLRDEPEIGNENYLWTFLIIAAGSVSCVVGGLISGKIGSEKVALYSLAGSGICGALLIAFPAMPMELVLPFLLLWGVLVVSDSPQFSTLVAQSVPAEHRGSALTLVNCFGFGLTIFSIQFNQLLTRSLPVSEFLGWLAVGPMLGLVAFRFFRTKS